MPTAHPSAPTILIVDDESLFRNSVVDALEASCPSYRVLEAGNGREALERIDETRVNVVITDVSMPVMDGLELMLALREQSFHGHVIIVTAFGNPRLENEVSVQGAFGYVEKPVDLPHLIDTIQNAAENEPSQIIGLTLAGFIQLLELERKTCRLRVSRGDRHGDLLLRDGILVDARLDRLSGTEAALELLAWDENAQFELHSKVDARRTTITEPLSHLLLEAMRLKDESTHDSSSLGDAADAHDQKKESPMSNSKECLAEAMNIEGAIGVALVDHESGMSLGQAGGGEHLNLDVASAGNTVVVQAKLRVMKDLGLDDEIEDILITLGQQFHLIRPLGAHPNLFLYLALKRDQANLAMARHKLMTIEKNLVL